MKVRRAFGPQRVLLLVAYGVRADGSRQLLAFTRARAESQAAWEAFLWDLHERGLAGRQLAVGDQRRLRRAGRGHRDHLSAGASSALLGAQDAQPAGRRTAARSGAMKRDAQRIYLAATRAQARRAFERFRFHWQALYPALVKRLERDLPELLTFFDFPAAAVAQAAHHQRHRALLRRSPAPHPAHGPVRQCSQRGANHLCHFSELQPAMAKPHPLAFYTSSLTSPFVGMSFRLEST